jgi:8-oxo-dGTP pyrophosphatase MutT (NUDIX family)
MVLLFRRDRSEGDAGPWLLPLTLRPATLARHAGQISLPGGSVDVGETTRETALRELQEELGVESGIDVLGQLPDCYVFASDFVVTPWVAAAMCEPQWRPHDSEVQGVVELPLDWLLDEGRVGRTRIERGPLVFHAPCIEVHDTCVWGATSVILAELAEVLEASIL